VFAELKGSCLILEKHFTLDKGVQSLDGDAVGLVWLVEVGQLPGQMQQQQQQPLPAWLLRLIQEHAGFGPVQQAAVIQAMQTYEEIDLEVSLPYQCSIAVLPVR
jgi:hypothetical protein